MITWDEIKSEFEFDGSWRDIYVLKTDIHMWQTMLDMLRRSHNTLLYIVDGNEADLPADIAAIFEKWKEATALLIVDVHGIGIACHFFGDDEIEFDIDPRQLDSATRLADLCNFMATLGRTLSREVLLTVENSADEVVLRYLPLDDQFVYTPVGTYAHSQWDDTKPL